MEINIAITSIKDKEDPWVECYSIEEHKILAQLGTIEGKLSDALIRTFPKGSRVYSSNYNPMYLWKLGYQIVTLNYQTPGYPLWINEARFMHSGGSGYVLKPKNEDIKAEILHVKIISGWHLPRPWGVSSSEQLSKPQVEISLWDPYTVGFHQELFTDISKFPKHHHAISLGNLPVRETIEDDDLKILQNIQHYYTKVESNSYHPIWNESFDFITTDPKHDILIFRVNDQSEVDNQGGSSSTNRIIGYYSIVVDDILSGIRIVPLKGEHSCSLLDGELLVFTERRGKEINT